MFAPLLAGLAGLSAGAASGMGLAATIGSSVLGAVGGIMQGVAAKQSGDYQAAVARNNATMARQAADIESAKGAQDAQAQDQKNKALQGAQVAALAASGVDITSGSPLDLQESSAKVGRLDTLTTRYNSDKRTNALQNQALQFDAEADVQKAKGNYGLLGGFISAESSILGGVSSFSDKWTAYKKAGV